MRARSLPRTVSPRPIRPIDPVTFARLARARDYLADRYDQHTRLEQAARQACLSPFHFNRLFLRIYGKTPHEFVTLRRIERAKRLLLAGNHSVTEVCFDVGYASVGSFSSRFRSLTGIAPAEFRHESRRLFGGFGQLWPLYYIPACFQSFFLGEP